MSKNDRFVVKHPKGWAVKTSGSTSPEGVFRKQSSAEASAKKTVAEAGGGEVRIQGRDGRWRDSDTVAPGNDPRRSRDTRH